MYAPSYLFGRMVFNALVGNDDDHSRNHAAILNLEDKRWRLSPAFDVAPNLDEHPRRLTIQLSTGRFDISREAVLAGALRFGFDSREDAAAYLDNLFRRVVHAFTHVESLLHQELKTMMEQRLHNQLTVLLHG